MFQIKTWLQNLNSKFDKIPEPWRLLTMLIIILPGIIAIQFYTIAIIYLLLVTLIRAMYIEGKLRQ